MPVRQLPSRALTGGPKYHWFGYYDKRQFDPTGRYVLGMEVDFEHRSPTPDDVLKVGIIDLEDGDRWIELGHSHAWCWQQGCMLQWRPGSDTDIIWNDRQDGQFVCHILNIHSGKKKTLPFPFADARDLAVVLALGFALALEDDVGDARTRAVEA